MGTDREPSNERHLTAQGQDRKAEIIRQAERLFTERGFADTRVSDIAEAAGVTKGLLYWYFENKEALLAEIVADMRTRLQLAQLATMAGAADVLGQTYLGTLASVRFVIENQRIYGLITYSGFGATLGPALVESARVHATDAARLIERGQREGVVRKTDTPLVLAHGNAGVVNNFCNAYATGLFTGTADDVAHAAARYIVRGLAATTELAEQTEADHGPKRRRRPTAVARR